MSKSPFFITLALTGALLGWLFLSQEEEGRPKLRKDGVRPAGARPILRSFGFPDPRGIVLEIYERQAQPCEASRFRAQSPEFVLWDDGTLVYRDSTYDYRRGHVPAGVGESWVRTASAYPRRKEPLGCEQAATWKSEAQTTRIFTRVNGSGVSFEFQDIERLGGDHAAQCDACRDIRPLARMLDEVHRRRTQGGDATLTGLPMEVYLQFRSCGCRDHPEIAKVSREWPVAGTKPSELCGKGAVRFRLENEAEIQSLAQALEKSAAVLDRGEIYTCFMRPLVDPKPFGPLARR